MASLQRVFSVIFFGALCYPAQARAQDSSAPMPTVQIAGPDSLALRRDATVAKIVVARADIVQYGDSNLADVLKRQPGISVTDGAVRMRGVGAGYTQILINGDPAPQGFSIGSISPEMVERIEILRSASAEQSTQAVAGSIHLVLRKVVTRAQRDAKLGGALERGRAGPTASVQLGERAGALSYSVGASFTRKVFEFTGRTLEDVRAADGLPVALRSFKRYNSGHDDQLDLSPRLNWALDNGDTVSWQNLIGISRADSGSGEPEATLFGAPTSYPGNSAVFLSRFSSLRSDAGWTHRIDEDGKLTAKLVALSSRRRSAYAFDGVNPNGVPALHRAVDSSVDEDSLAFSGKFFTPLGAGHGLGIGWDGGFITRGEARLQADSRLSKPAAVVLDQAYTARVQRMALFAQDEWEMSSQLQGYFGLRWEGVCSATDGKDFARVGNRYSVFSPSAQLLWTLPERPRDQLRLALARTYKAPLTRDLVPRRYTMNNDNSAANPDQEGNPTLRPELSWGLDLAYEMYFRTNGVASVSVFARRIQDVTVQRLYRDGPAWVSRPENAGAAETHGIEFDIKLPLRLTLPVELHANLTRAWSHLDAVAGPYNRLADQTPLTANLGFDVRPGGRWSFGANASYQGAATNRSALERSSYQSSECLLDVYTVWQMDKRTKLRVTGANLLQRGRRSIESYADANGSIRRSGIADGSASARVVLEQGF